MRVSGAWMLAVLLLVVAVASFVLGYHAMLRFMG